MLTNPGLRTDNARRSFYEGGVVLLKKTTILLFGSLILLNVGCTNDADEDGLTLAQEAELGTDDTKADTDGDGLTDLEEVEFGSNPTLVDTDDDGLNDKGEYTAKSNPAMPDTDMDGFLDGEEVDADSDPLHHHSYPFDGLSKGMWPDRSAAAEANALFGTGWGEGKVMPNIELIDQFDVAFNLHQLYGYYILLDFSAGWCGPCRNAATHAQELFEDLRDVGFMVVHVLLDTNSQGQAPDSTFLQSWQDDYELTFPVCAEKEHRTNTQHTINAGLGGWSIPFMVLLTDEMVIDSAYGSQVNGVPSEEVIKERVLELVAEEEE